jgi:transglutaminase-like putative cysteine protease
MALLRASGIPCRFHGATIHKRLQQGIVPHLAYRIAPQDILHSWAEVFHDGTWVELEGVICDTPYLGGLRKKTGATKAFLGFGVGTENLADPPVQWCGSDTAIQKTGVNQDFQTYDNPDDFYSQHGENLNGIRGIVYRLIVRHLMNRRVSAIRNAG